MKCPYKHPCCDTKVETVGDGIHRTNDCVNDVATDLLVQIEQLKEQIRQLKSQDGKIEFGVHVGEPGYVVSPHFHASHEVYEYMNLVLAKDPKFKNIPMRVVFREVGEWKDDKELDD